VVSSKNSTDQNGTGNNGTNKWKIVVEMAHSQY